MAPRPAAGATEPARQRELLSAGDVARTIARIAHQVIEKTALDSAAGASGSSTAESTSKSGSSEPGSVILLGIPSRGTPLAQRLANRIADFSGVELPVGALDITLYRDDLRTRPHRPLGDSSLPSQGLDGARVILVDDVLFSGRSVRAALDALRDLGRPESVQLAVLVDRGHRELPIRADYVGKNVPTARTEQVAVQLAEVDGEDRVLLYQSLDQQEGQS